MSKPLSSYYTGKPSIGVYYASYADRWTTTVQSPVGVELYNIPTSYNLVYLSFVMPKSTYVSGQNDFGGINNITGLEFINTFDIIKQSVANLKSKGTVVLLSVGGGTYDWNGFNATHAASITALVNDLGCNGIDVDYEEDTGGMSGQRLANCINLLHTSAAGNYTISFSAMHCSGYGEAGTPWENTYPTSPYRNFGWQALKTYGAASKIDLINLQSYDAGPQPGTYDPAQAFDAYRSYYSGPILLGVEVPPEGSGTNIINESQIQYNVNKVLTDSQTNGNGIFIWDYSKVPNAANSTWTAPYILSRIQARMSAFSPPASSKITFYLNKTDAVAGTNPIGTNTTNYLLSRTDTGNRGGVTRWGIANRSTGTSNKTVIYRDTDVLNADGEYHMYAIPLLYFRTKSDAIAGTGELIISITLSSDIGGYTINNVEGFYSISPALTTGTSDNTRRYISGDTLNAPGMYYLVYVPANIVYYPDKASADAQLTNTIVAINRGNTNVGFTTFGNIGSTTEWRISSIASTGSSDTARVYENGDILNADGGYHVYPASQAPVSNILYFATEAAADLGSSPIGENNTNYTLGTANIGSIGTTTSWRISRVSSTGSSNNTVVYNNTDSLNADGVYYVYPASPVVNKITFYMNKNDATSGVNAIGTNITNYEIARTDTGNRGGITRWGIASRSTGSSNKTVIYRQIEVLNADGEYHLYAIPLLYFAKKSDAIVGTNPLNTIASSGDGGYIISGTAAGFGLFFNISPTLTRGTSDNTRPYRDGDILTGPGMYYLVAGRSVATYYADQASADAQLSTALARDNSVLNAVIRVGDITVGNSRSIDEWRISSIASTGSADTTRVYQNGDYIAPDGAYYFYPANPLTLPDAPCFCKGTQILTNTGYKNIENLNNKSDMIITSDNRAVSFKMYSFVAPKTNTDTAPYLIPAGSMSSNYPPQDLRVSPLHAIKDNRGVWQIPEILAKTNKKIVQFSVGKDVQYYHIECPNYFTDNLLANGIVVESLNNNQNKEMTNVYAWDTTISGYNRFTKLNSSVF